jgi:hypothetical protein
MIYMLTLGLMALLFIGVPVGFGLGAAALYSNYFGSSAPLFATIISQKMLFGLQNFLLVAIPLFILAAKLMNTAGITKKLFGFANTMVGFMPGGLGHSNIIASLIFAGMSGAAVADAAGLGQIELNAMKDAGYDDEFAVAVTAASSTVGPIFPPSIPMVVFSFVSGASVGRCSWAASSRLPHVRHLDDHGRLLRQETALPARALPDFQGCRKEFRRGVPSLDDSGDPPGRHLVRQVHPHRGRRRRGVLRPGARRRRLPGARSGGRGAAVQGNRPGNRGHRHRGAATAFYGWILMKSGFTIYIGEWLIGITQNPTLILLIINVFLLIVGCFLDSTVAILIITRSSCPSSRRSDRLGALRRGDGAEPHDRLADAALRHRPFVMQHVSGLKFDRIVKAWRRSTSLCSWS